MPKRPRRLFLDDDPLRAEVFLAEHPDALWVQTAPGCIARLAAEPWDEVHLDHDLGGEHYVDSGRDDCGMAVVSWLEGHPRRVERLRRARFVVHSHNMVAAFNMVLRLRAIGCRVEARPFGLSWPEEEFPGDHQLENEGRREGRWDRVRAWFPRFKARRGPSGTGTIDAKPPDAGS